MRPGQDPQDSHDTRNTQDTHDTRDTQDTHDTQDGEWRALRPRLAVAVLAVLRGLVF